ncbi:MAG TPA: glycosyltransferase family 4 protein, partial [Rhodopila sp.]
MSTPTTAGRSSWERAGSSGAVGSVAMQIPHEATRFFREPMPTASRVGAAKTIARHRQSKSRAHCTVSCSNAYRPMKILHLTLSAAVGGRRDAIMTLVDHLRPLGIECGVVALRDSASGIATLADRADYVDGLAFRARPTWHELNQVRQICRERDVDLVHAHDHGSQYVASALRLLSPSLRAVMTFHRTLGIETEGRRNRTRNALTLPLIQRVLTASDERRKYFIDSTLIWKSKVEVIPIGIDLDRFRPNCGARPAIRQHLGMDPDVPLVLAIGHFGPEKGVDQALAAAAHAATLLGDRAWQLAVLGTGPADRVSELHTMGDQILPGRVSWAGFQNDVTPWLQAADLLVHAPRREAFGMVVVQAMACGLPVAALA